MMVLYQHVACVGLDLDVKYIDDSDENIKERCTNIKHVIERCEDDIASLEQKRDEMMKKM